MHHQRGHALYKLRRYREAAADFDAALAPGALDPHLLTSRGLARAASGQLEEGIADLEESLRASPAQTGIPTHLAFACNQLSRTLSFGPVSRRDPERALFMARRARSLEPENPAHLNTLGVALYRASRPAEA